MRLCCNRSIKKQNNLLLAPYAVRVRSSFALCPQNLTGRTKLKETFDVVSLGCRHVHLAGPTYGLDKVRETEACC